MLLKRQTAILDQYLLTVSTDNGCHPCYDELPATLRAALEQVKNQETLCCDVERHISDRLVERMWPSSRRYSKSMKKTNGSKANVSEAQLVAELVAQRAVVIETIQSLISQTVAETNNGVASVLWLSRIEDLTFEAFKTFFILSEKINSVTQ